MVVAMENVPNIILVQNLVKNVQMRLWIEMERLHQMPANVIVHKLRYGQA